MNENELPKPIPNPEQEPKGHPRTSVAELSPAHTEQAPEWLTKYTDEPETPKLSAEDQQKIIQALSLALTYFERAHPIAELYAITNLAVKDAPNHLAREAAKQGLAPIAAALSLLKERSDISPEKYEELKEHYKYLTRAVGIIEAKTGKVDHER